MCDNQDEHFRHFFRDGDISPTGISKMSPKDRELVMAILVYKNLLPIFSNPYIREHMKQKLLLSKEDVNNLELQAEKTVNDREKARELERARARDVTKGPVNEFNGCFEDHRGPAEIARVLQSSLATSRLTQLLQSNLTRLTRDGKRESLTRKDLSHWQVSLDSNPDHAILGCSFSADCSLLYVGRGYKISYKK